MKRQADNFINMYYKGLLMVSVLVWNLELLYIDQNLFIFIPDILTCWLCLFASVMMRAANTRLTA